LTVIGQGASDWEGRENRDGHEFYSCHCESQSMPA